MEIFWPVDRAIGELNPRLPVSDIRELNSQMSCNLFASDDENTLWLDCEDELDHIRVISEEEFIETYLD